MKKMGKNLIKDAVFTALLITCLFTTNQVLVKKKTYRNSQWPSTSSYEQFYQMQKDSIDVLFLGSSYAMNAFIPQEIYDDYGITSYNLACEQQSMFTSYYWLKEALNYQKPKAVVLECRFAFSMHPENALNTSEGLLRSAFDPMKNSSVKREAVKDIVQHDSSQSALSYYLTNIRFHGRYDSLEDIDFKPSLYQKAELKGFGPIFNNHIDSYEPFVPSDSDVRMEFALNMQEYMDKITELCSQNSIQLILVSVPSSNMNDAMHNTLTRYADAHHVSYYDFSQKDLYEEIGAFFPEASLVDHENFKGARKMSAYMGKLLSENGIKGKKDSQYEETEDFYRQIIIDADLVQINDPVQYLHTLNQSHYTVLMACRNDIASILNEEMLYGLKKLGIKADFTGKYYWSYYAVKAGNSIFESLGEPSQNAEGKTGDALSIWKVSSSGKNTGNQCSIQIDGKEYAMSEDGLNIVIYDNALHRVIDSTAVISESEMIRDDFVSDME